MTDELDLVGELGNAQPLRPEAYRRARAVLRAAMADPGTVRLPGTISAEDTTMETNSTTDTTTTRDHESSPRNRCQSSGEPCPQPVPRRNRSRSQMENT